MLQSAAIIFGDQRRGAFFKVGDTGVKADTIAAQQLHALKQHYNGKLRLTDIKQIFLQMRDQA
jgi:hypothetical protein